MAWRKVAGYSRTFVATADVFAGLLKGRGVFKVRHPNDGHHVEARINYQVLALIDEGKVQRIYHTSSGEPSTPTVRGKFHVYMKTPEPTPRAWSTRTTSSAATPSTATSRCRRTTPATAACACRSRTRRSIYDWLRIGDVVWVEP